MQKDYTGTVDLGSSWEFMNYSKGICKTLKATNDRISVIEIINLSERIDMKNDLGKIAKQASGDMPFREFIRRKLWNWICRKCLGYDGFDQPLLLYRVVEENHTFWRLKSWM